MIEYSWQGDGTSMNPYQISNSNHLLELATAVNQSHKKFAGTYFKLTCNLDLASVQRREGWSPIGTFDHPFSGKFDGGFYIIKNMTISNHLGINQGLFGYLEDAGVIQNLGVVGNISYSQKELSCGGVVGTNHGEVSGCFAQMDFIGTSKSCNIGGIVGYNMSSGTVKQCFFIGTINRVKIGADTQEPSYIGGIAGANQGSINACYQNGELYSMMDDYVGGIVGTTTSDKINNCYNTGKITGKSKQIGGIAGQSKQSFTLASCFYWDKSVSEAGGGGVPKTFEQMTVQDFLSVLNQEKVLYSLDSASILPSITGFTPYLIIMNNKEYYLPYVMSSILPKVEIISFSIQKASSQENIATMQWETKQAGKCALVCGEMIISGLPTKGSCPIPLPENADKAIIKLIAYHKISGYSTEKTTTFLRPYIIKFELVKKKQMDISLTGDSPFISLEELKQLQTVPVVNAVYGGDDWPPPPPPPPPPVLKGTLKWEASEAAYCTLSGVKDHLAKTGSMDLYYLEKSYTLTAVAYEDYQVTKTITS